MIMLLRSRKGSAAGGRNGFESLARAMFLGFRRDRRALFFSVIFPLMFLVIFGGIFGHQSTPKTTIAQIGSVPILDAAAGSKDLTKYIKITKYTDGAKALDKVKKGDVDGAVAEQGGRIVLYYSAADQTRSATVQGVISSVVQSANVASSGQTPRFTLAPQQIEDKSLKAIQYYTPGLLGWALASAGIFGAAQTLVQWRTTGLLRRLRLSPVPIRSVFAARVVVSLGVALVQMALFILVARLPVFGLKLSHYWWMSVPVVMSGVLAFLAIGMVIGAWAKTQDSAQTITQLVVFPMAFLGGSFFPLAFAPGWLQVVSHIFPLRYVNDGMTNVMVRGLPPSSALLDIGVLLGIALAATLVALRLFKWDDA